MSVLSKDSTNTSLENEVNNATTRFFFVLTFDTTVFFCSGGIEKRLPH